LSITESLNIDLIVKAIERNELEINEIVNTSFWLDNLEDKTVKQNKSSSLDISEELKVNNQIVDLKSKLKKYKDEICKLKERIKSQNQDIEDAIQHLIVNKNSKNKISKLTAFSIFF
jgi:hypothetical protein